LRRIDAKYRIASSSESKRPRLLDEEIRMLKALLSGKVEKRRKLLDQLEREKTRQDQEFASDMGYQVVFTC